MVIREIQGGCFEWCCTIEVALKLLRSKSIGWWLTFSEGTYLLRFVLGMLQLLSQITQPLLLCYKEHIQMLFWRHSKFENARINEEGLNEIVSMITKVWWLITKKDSKLSLMITLIISLRGKQVVLILIMMWSNLRLYNLILHMKILMLCFIRLSLRMSYFTCI